MKPVKVYVRSTYCDGRKEVGCFWTKDTKKFLTEFKEMVEGADEVSICSESEYCTFQLAESLQFRLTQYQEAFDCNNTGEICNQVTISFGKN